MISFIWNVRGVENKSTQQHIWYLKNMLKANVFVIIEPKIHLDPSLMCIKFRMEKVVCNISNKIWIFNDESYAVDILEDKEQHLHCRISSQQLLEPLYWTLVYAKCTSKERKVLWDDLIRLSIRSSPWCKGGDFNIISALEEREGGSRPDMRGMQDFNDCILDCGLHDVGYEGIPFTWQWRGVKQRLDRVLLNHSCIYIFRDIRVSHGARLCLDHRPIICHFNAISSPRSGAFRFQNMWLQHPEGIQNIEKNWQIPARHKGLKKLWEKLHRLSNTWVGGTRINFVTYSKT